MKKNRIAAVLSSIVILAAGSGEAAGQSAIVKDFKPACDSLNSILSRRTTVDGDLKIKSIMKRGNVLDFYFTESLGDYPWKEAELKEFRKTLRSLFPEGYERYSVGEIYSDRIGFGRLGTPYLTCDGKPAETAFRVKDRTSVSPLSEKIGGLNYSKGLEGRNLAVWQSHGRYYEQSIKRWEWQRACLFQTVEDLFTQSFVVPFLVPMLENSGAYVMLPRERDSNIHEIISDNDACYADSLAARTHGRYRESGRWSDAGTGFGDIYPYYRDHENPFALGTARMAECTPYRTSQPESSVTWTPDIPQRGEYAVYVSYKTLANSTDCAHYTVRHLGGETHFRVNQTIGGGTWIYLGTFEFGKGTSGYVTLDSTTPQNGKFRKGKVVTADAVKFGGGMGNIIRGNESSGMPRFVEGARYWMQWSGIDSSVYDQNEGSHDYRDDFMSRGAWVNYLTGGSDVNPKSKGLGIPIDLALGFHSDAGTYPNDSIVGTLAIYTLKCEGKDIYPSGHKRMTAREYADIVQEQIVRDIRHRFDTSWTRRSLWDRSYSECRTPPVPSILVELLSHQNFEDMKYGLNPEFKFTVSRAVYKGILKYMSNRYGTEYAVQPLPVNSFAAGLSYGKDGYTAELSWKDTPDPLEKTADPEGYIIYIRKDDGGFDNGTVVKSFDRKEGRICTRVPVEKGHIYSFKIEAYNEGGKSFPSEILSVGLPSSCDKDMLRDSCILIVNNFDRISQPAYFDTPIYAGFDNDTDSGVPYMKDYSFTGKMYQNRRNMEWTDDDNPGFGASHNDFAGKVIAGNTFDYTTVHGKVFFTQGYPFHSSSSNAFSECGEPGKGAWITDIICGKQLTTRTGRNGGSDKFRVFPERLQKAIACYTSNGGNIFISGANIATDIWDSVFPVRIDSTFRSQSIRFAENVLGYRWMTNYASKTAEVKSCLGEPVFGNMTFSFCNEPNSMIYCVETPDGIVPADPSSRTIFRYADTNISAGICFNNRKHGYKTVVLGFPVETVRNRTSMEQIFSSIINYFIHER